MNLFEKQARLNQFFTQNPVNAAYLAGNLSTRATFGQLSDVDVAILLMDQVKTDQFLDYQMYFLSELAKRLDSDTVDVVILNQASLLLKLQVIKHGQILFTRNEKQRVSFETRAVMDYLDFKKFDEIQNQALGRRIYGQNLPIDKELIDSYLKNLRFALTILQELAQTQRENFISDYHTHGLAERYLQQAVESCLAICATLIAAFGLQRPEGYHDMLSTIARQQIIPQSLAYRLELLTNLRDDLVHNPQAISHEALYEHLQHHLTDLATFAETMGKRQE